MGSASYNENEASLSLKSSFYKKESLLSLKSLRALKLWKTCGKLDCPPEVIEQKAQFLVDKFNAPYCRLYFLKCIHHLSEYDIQRAIELSTRPDIKSPVRYFNAVTKAKLRKLGY